MSMMPAIDCHKPPRCLDSDIDVDADCCHNDDDADVVGCDATRLDLAKHRDDADVVVCDMEALRLSQRIGIPIPIPQSSRTRGVSRSINIPALPTSSRLMHVSRVAAAH